MYQRPLLLLFSVVGILLVGSSTAAPNLRFQIPFQTNYPQGVYTSPHGVSNATSPFVIVNGKSIASVSASGQHLASLDINTIDTDTKPVMEYDANNNTLFVAALQNGSLIAVAAETMKMKWMYTASIDLCNPAQNMYCSVQGMVFVEPTLAPTTCSNGAGALSFILCGDSGDSPTTCSVRLVDIESGVLCNVPTNLPNKDGFGSFSDNFLVFPRAGNLQSPVFVNMQPDVELMVGVDAVSGNVLYTIPCSNSVNSLTFRNFVAGVSPGGDLFAYWMADSNDKAFLVVRTVANGVVTLQTPFAINVLEFAGTTAWTTLPGSYYGGISLTGYDSAKKAYVALSYNAYNGSLALSNQMGGEALMIRVASAGNWLFAVELNAGLGYNLNGFPVSGAGRSWFTSLPSVTGSESSAGPLATFSFSDGGAGVAIVVWGSDNDTAYLSVFNV